MGAVGFEPTYFRRRGIYSLILFLAFVINLIFRSWKKYKVENHNFLKLFFGAIYYSSLVYFVTSLTTETWFGITHAGLYWIFAGFVFNKNLITQIRGHNVS